MLTLLLLLLLLLAAAGHNVQLLARGQHTVSKPSRLWLVDKTANLLLLMYTQAASFAAAVDLPAWNPCSAGTTASMFKLQSGGNGPVSWSALSGGWLQGSGCTTKGLAAGHLQQRSTKQSWQYNTRARKQCCCCLS
jgi:hypothetical protein